MDIIQSTFFTKLPLDGPQVQASLAFIDKHRLDAYPGILLRVCLDRAANLRATGHDLVLISSVKRLLQVARAEGLQTFNPATQTQKELDVLVGA